MQSNLKRPLTSSIKQWAFSIRKKAGSLAFVTGAFSTESEVGACLLKVLPLKSQLQSMKMDKAKTSGKPSCGTWQATAILLDH